MVSYWNFVILKTLLLTFEKLLILVFELDGSQHPVTKVLNHEIRKAESSILIFKINLYHNLNPQ